MNLDDASPLQVLEGRDFSPALAQAWADLMDAVWPMAEGPRSLDGALERLHRWSALHFARFDLDGQMLCHAMLFARDMSADGHTFRVGCLAGVCVRPEFRELGLGREVVLAAFGALPQLAPVMLFQTGVPTFYEKLDARLVHNRCVHARSDEPEKNPFWEHHVMIYPRDYDWPETTIDIGGGGF